MAARAELDFYAPVKDYRDLTRQRLDAQRAAMFAWRTDYATTTFDARTGARRAWRNDARLATAPPREHLLPGTQRAAAAMLQQQQQQQAATPWQSCSGGGGAHVCWPHAMSRSARRRRPYVPSATLAATTTTNATKPPYFHDGITLCAPIDGQDVLAFAITHNTSEALQQAAAAAAATTTATQAQTTTSTRDDDDTSKNDDDDDNDGNAATVVDEAWVRQLGPTMLMRQHALQLATTLQRDLHTQQQQQQQQDEQHAYGHDTRSTAAATTTTTTRLAQTMPVRASAATRTLQPLRTCELAYTLRPSFVAKQRQRSRRRDGGSVTRADDTLPVIATRAATAATTATPEYDDNDDDDEAAMWSRYGAPHRLPAEAKSMRVYAVRLRRRVADADASMERRREPLRRGVPVRLPPSWRTPMTAP